MSASNIKKSKPKVRSKREFPMTKEELDYWLPEIRTSIAGVYAHLGNPIDEACEERDEEISAFEKIVRAASKHWGYDK